jgi:leucyl/phenylalanyl-tRNA--protein transferase
VPQQSGQPHWDFDLSRVPPGEDLVGVGADLEVATLLQAYREGVFPMGVGRHGGPPIGWWSPDPRGVLRLGGIRVTRSLRRALPRFEVRVDTEFVRVIEACAEPSRPGRWITPEIVAAYVELHGAGWAHSIETWQDGELVGGLYGVAIGGLFAGESMFHHVRDASKVALVHLHELLALDAEPDRLIDVQWATPHLTSLGVTEVSRDRYGVLLDRALRLPLPAAWA